MGTSKKDKTAIKKLVEENKALQEKIAALGMTIQQFIDASDETQAEILKDNYNDFRDKYYWHEPCPPGQKFNWDTHLCEGTVIVPPVEPPTEPPVEEPPTTGGQEKDANGIVKIYADKQGGVFINSSQFTEEEFTRNYASGKPSENSYECEYKDSNKLENEEVTYYCQINGFKSETDTMSVKLLGNKHSDGSKDKWLIYQLMTDGGNEDNFQIEDPHPTNHDNHQPTAFTIGESIVGKVVGFKAITFIDSNGKRHAETWLDFPTSFENPTNNWRKYIDIKDVEALSHGFLNATNGGALLRIDGTKKGDMPTTKFMSIREIVPEGGVVIPPTIPPVEPPTEPPVEPPVTPPPVVGNVLWDSNKYWNDGKPRTVTGLDPTGAKVFTNSGAIEMHASGNPQLEIDGKGVGTLACEPGHGRFYIDACNYDAALEYEVNFLDGSVENQTMNLRSRHQEGEPPANRMGGIQAKLDLKNYDFKTEIFHNEHENSSGDKPLPKALELNKWYKVKYTVKDVATDLYQGMELDYGDGKGYVKVGEQTIKSPNKVYMEKDKILARSYAWLRMNNSKNAKIAFRNVKIIAL